MQDDFSDDEKPPPSLPPPQLVKPGGVAAGGNVGGVANTLNLGMAQIIVTAATPMVEDGADKSFPPVGESDKTESQPAKEQQPDVEKKAKPKPDIVPKPSAAKIAAHKQPPKEGNVGRSDEVEDQVASAVTITLTEYHVSAEDEHQSFDSADGTVAVVQQPEDPFVEKSAAGAAPAVAAAAEGASAGFEADFEANFDANFDDAFAGSGAGAGAGAGGGGGGGGGGQSTGLDMNPEAQAEDVIEAPKQVVGGRASIPEELDSNQLARLENLKESNA